MYSLKFVALDKAIDTIKFRKIIIIIIFTKLFKEVLSTGYFHHATDIKTKRKRVFQSSLQYFSVIFSKKSFHYRKTEKNVILFILKSKFEWNLTSLSYGFSINKGESVSIFETKSCKAFAYEHWRSISLFRIYLFF